MLLSLLRSGFNGGLDFFSVIVYILSSLLTIFLVLPLHECAHGFVANKLGDDTAKRQGRLTLNPLAHIDYIGAALLILVGFGWAKPVPINARRFKNPKAGMAISALAGPVSNLLAAIIAGLIYNGLFALLLHTVGVMSLVTGLWKYIFLFLQFFIMINIGLAVFNFIPIPPLDGSKILMAFLPDKLIFKIAQYEQMISIILMIVILMGGLNGILNFLDGWLYDLIMMLTKLPFLWAL